MKTRMKCFTAFASLFMAGALLLTGAAALRGLTASAATEANPEAGWYVVGNGNKDGSLGTCSWTEYVPEFRLTGKSTGTSSKGYEEYLGTWTTGELRLYSNDQFKFLYESGAWAYPNDSGWGADIVADLGDLENQGDFIDGGLGNIQVAQGASAVYTFTLTVSEDATNGISIKLSYEKGDDLDEPTTSYDMYLVGDIASHPNLGWPNAINPDTQLPYEWKQFHMEPRWVIETEEGKDKDQVVLKYYTEVAIEFAVTDQVKVYNAADNLYYPSGVEDNVSPEEAGTFYVEWKKDAPSIRFVISIPDAQTPPTNA